jgi:diguanylate cyclase (GGDEF)-like protein
MEPRLERRGSPQDFQATSAQVLKHLHATVGLDLWAVGRRQGTDWVVLTSEGGDLDGLQLRWDDTLCARVQDGRAGWATPDVDQVPTLAEARDLIGLPIRSFVTVPLHGGDGEVLGTLCGAGTAGPAGEDLGSCRDELQVLAQVLGALLSAELRLEREARHREVAEQDAQTDPLTGLGNRRRWDRQLAAEEERCRRYGSSAAVVTADLDGLKVINDRWGHDAGDTLLRQLAAVLRRECRPGDVVARLGGDEFAVLLAEAGEEQAAAVSERLRAALSAASVSASLGVAVRGREGLAGAWRDADARMYEEKVGLTHREPVRPGAAESAPDLQHGPLLQELLALARQHTGADIVFLGRVEGGKRVLRAVEAAEPPPIRSGDSDDLESTYCARVLTGELPSAIPDTSRNPAAAGLPVTTALPIGAYLGVPVTLPDGRLYGTLCCVSHQPNPAFDEAAVRLLTSIAGSLSRALAEEEDVRQGRRTLLAAIDELLARKALTMLYQPVVDLPSGAVRGVEALARFDDHSRSTAQWFADATKVDRTAELELRTAALALDETAAWPGELWLNLSASVLVSPAVSGLLAGRDLTRVVVEISEHEEVPDYATLRRALAPWRERGLRLAVDDAGAGFSSLRHVLELAPDVIKLDISLVQGLPADPARRALVSALVAFADQAGALVVAEGIESEAELEALRGTGVTLGQGYHLGRPLVAATLPGAMAPGDVPLPRSPRPPVPH